MKRPTGIYIIAFLFVLAPLGSLLINFFTLLPAYNNESYGNFFNSVPALDWWVLSLTLMSGILLFLPHKTSWSLAMLGLAGVLSLNIYRWLTRDLFSPLGWDPMQLIGSCATTLMFLIFIFYFRYPYLDRRAQWLLPTAQRYPVKVPVQVVAQKTFEAMTESISITGMRATMPEDFDQRVQLKVVELILPFLGNLKIEAQVVEQEARTLRLKFRSVSRADSKRMKEWLEATR